MATAPRMNGPLMHQGILTNIEKGRVNSAYNAIHKAMNAMEEGKLEMNGMAINAAVKKAFTNLQSAELKQKLIAKLNESDKKENILSTLRILLNNSDRNLLPQLPAYEPMGAAAVPLASAPPSSPNALKQMLKAPNFKAFIGKQDGGKSRRHRKSKKASRRRLTRRR